MITTHIRKELFWDNLWIISNSGEGINLYILAVLVCWTKTQRYTLKVVDPTNVRRQSFIWYILRRENTFFSRRQMCFLFVRKVTVHIVLDYFISSNETCFENTRHIHDEKQFIFVMVSFLTSFRSLTCGVISIQWRDTIVLTFASDQKKFTSVLTLNTRRCRTQKVFIIKSTRKTFQFWNPLKWTHQSQIPEKYLYFLKCVIWIQQTIQKKLVESK